MNDLREHLLKGLVIPALPLALNEDGSWAKQHQQALVRYYADAGAGGLAVGVHSTQFEIKIFIFLTRISCVFFVFLLRL